MGHGVLKNMKAVIFFLRAASCLLLAKQALCLKPYAIPFGGSAKAGPLARILYLFSAMRLIFFP
jgi:hypothetical protein